MTYKIPAADQGTGPLYSFSLIFDGVGNAVSPDSEGAIEVSGKIVDGTGGPVRFPDGLIEFLHGDQFARAQTDADGNYRVTLRKPKIAKLNDGTLQAPHLEIVLFIHPVMSVFRTRMYFPDELDANAKDPVLARVPASLKSTLVAKPHKNGLQFDIVLQGDKQTAFFQPTSS
jgi:protocatechuate 3,4-dioxygenase alpha subunit